MLKRRRGIRIRQKKKIIKDNNNNQWRQKRRENKTEKKITTCTFMYVRIETMTTEVYQASTGLTFPSIDGGKAGRPPTATRMYLQRRFSVPTTSPLPPGAYLVICNV